MKDVYLVHRLFGLTKESGTNIFINVDRSIEFFHMEIIMCDMNNLALNDKTCFTTERYSGKLSVNKEDTLNNQNQNQTNHNQNQNQSNQNKDLKLNPESARIDSSEQEYFKKAHRTRKENRKHPDDSKEKVDVHTKNMAKDFDHVNDIDGCKISNIQGSGINDKKQFSNLVKIAKDKLFSQLSNETDEVTKHRLNDPNI